MSDTNGTCKVYRDVTDHDDDSKCTQDTQLQYELSWYDAMVDTKWRDKRKNPAKNSSVYLCCM